MSFLTQDARALIRIATAFARHGDLHSATGCAELATVADPSSPDAWVTLGVLHAKAKSYEAAWPCYVRALQLRPDDISAWTDLGELLTLLLDYERAASALRQAMLLDRNANHPSGRRARAIVGRTLALLKSK